MCNINRLPISDLLVNLFIHPHVACVAADSFPFSGRAEIEQANEKRVSEHPVPLLLILPLFRSLPPVRERLEKERKRLLGRLFFP